MDTPYSTDNFSDQFFNELQVAISALDVAIESGEDIEPEVAQLILTARAHAQAMIAPARWLLRQYEDSLKREKTLECALDMALDIGREKNYDSI